MTTIRQQILGLSCYAPALPTPFNDADEIDFPAFERLCDRQVQEGATALVVCGTTGEAPPFASIAKKPGFDAGQIAVFLLDPHPKMPNMSLTRNEAGDLAAYIATLGK